VRSRHTTVVAAVCLVVSIAASVFLLRSIDRLRPSKTDDDVLYVDSPKLIRKVGLGFDGLMACLYWTRAVQYFGARHVARAQTYNQLAPLLEVTTTLDPQLIPAYELGASFLAPAPPAGAGEPKRAVQLMEYGIAHNPDNWRLYYDLGFVYYTELKDYKHASEAFERGSLTPNAHPAMKVLAARMAEHGGDLVTARMLWSTTYQSSKDTSIRQNAWAHLRALQVDEDVTNLQTTVNLFVFQNGRAPTSMWELAAAEHWTDVPADPDGVPYTLSLDGEVLVANPDDFPFITKGTPPGYKPGRPKFDGKVN
jgi:hypothetical protein